MKTLNRYIYHAAGIILLLDPLSIKGIRAELAENSYNATKADSDISREIISRVASVVFQGLSRSTRKKTIDIPLAITFSKVDLLQDVLGNDSPVYQPSRHQGFFNLRDFKNINANIHNWIKKSETKLLGATGVFQDIAFFGISALGCDPIPTEVAPDEIKKKMPYEPRPIRVEDPFLWLLYENNFINGK